MAKKKKLTDLREAAKPETLIKTLIKTIFGIAGDHPSAGHGSFR